ncbi:internal scaffolding protein [Microviridae sp.]|nr:internal scaffolding protein [Microviridae sp.]
MAKYQKTGLIDHVQRYKGQYGDVSGADFKSAQDLVAEQKTIFYELPSSVRAEFDNDPAEYLDLLVQDDGPAILQDLLNPAPEPAPEPKKEPETDSKTGEQEEKPVT